MKNIKSITHLFAGHQTHDERTLKEHELVNGSISDFIINEKLFAYQSTFSKVVSLIAQANRTKNPFFSGLPGEVKSVIIDVAGFPIAPFNLRVKAADTFHRKCYKTLRENNQRIWLKLTYDVYRIVKDEVDAIRASSPKELEANAAFSYMEIFVRTIRKDNYADVCQSPEDYGIPSGIFNKIKKYIDKNALILNKNNVNPLTLKEEKGAFFLENKAWMISADNLKKVEEKFRENKLSYFRQFMPKKEDKKLGTVQPK